MDHQLDLDRLFAGKAWREFIDPMTCSVNASIPLLNNSTTTTYRTAGAIYISATLRRLQLYEANMGQQGTLATTDCQVQWDLSRFGTTGAAAGTAVTPNLLDTADSATVNLAMNNFTTEPTYTTGGAGLSIYNWSINQRGFNRWRALDDGDNIIVPGTSPFGLGLRAQSISGGFVASLVGSASYIER